MSSPSQRRSGAPDRVLERARRAVAGYDPPTAPIALRVPSSRTDDGGARAALGLALRVGEAMLALGAPAGDVTATVLRVAAAYGLTDCHVDVTLTALVVSWDRDGAVPLTAFRTVRARPTDFNRLHGVTALAQTAAAGGLDVEEAHRRLDQVVSAPPTYRRSVHALGWSGVAASVAFLLGGGPLVMAIAGGTTAAIAQTMRALDRKALPLFFQQAIGAALATTVAVLLVVGGVDVRTSLVVAAGIVVLLAGLSLVGAAEDAITGFPVTAAGRACEVVTLTAGIVVGIAGVLDLAQRANVPLDVVDASPPAASFGVALVASAGIAGSWALACHARPRSIAVAAAAGALGWASSSATAALGGGPAVASGVAAVVLGFCGALLTERLRIPPQLIVVCGIVPLLPGLTIYQGLFAVVVEADLPTGLGALVRAGAVGLALAAGVTLGEYLGGPPSRTLDRFDHRVRRRATTTE